MTKILIIDQNLFEINKLSEFLSAQDIETVAVQNVKEALKHLRSGDLTAIFTDMFMPSFEGIRLLKILRRLEIPVPVVCMGYCSNDEFTWLEPMVSVFNGKGFLRKPLQHSEITDVLEEQILHPK